VTLCSDSWWRRGSRTYVPIQIAQHVGATFIIEQLEESAAKNFALVGRKSPNYEMTAELQEIRSILKERILFVFSVTSVII
jgi:hypothetical protein